MYLASVSPVTNKWFSSIVCVRANMILCEEHCAFIMEIVVDRSLDYSRSKCLQNPWKDKYGRK